MGWSPDSRALRTPGPPSLVPFFGPCVGAMVTGPRVLTWQQQYPRPPTLVPPGRASPCPLFLFIPPTTYLFNLSAPHRVRLSPRAPSLGCGQPHAPSVLGSSWLPGGTVSLGLASGTCPWPWPAPPGPSRGPRHQQHLMARRGAPRVMRRSRPQTVAAPRGLPAAGSRHPLRTSRGSDRTFLGRPVPSTWGAMSGFVPGPHVGLGALEVSFSRPERPASSAWCPLSPDPSPPLPCPAPAPSGRGGSALPLCSLFPLRGIWPRRVVPETQLSPLFWHELLCRCSWNLVSELNVGKTVAVCGRWVVGEQGGRWGGCWTLEELGSLCGRKGDPLHGSRASEEVQGHVRSVPANPGGSPVKIRSEPVPFSPPPLAAAWGSLACVPVSPLLSCLPSSPSQRSRHREPDKT